MLIAITGMILITSHSQVAFAGVVGGGSDPDGDEWFSDDNCPLVYNPGQEDVNDDGVGDACVTPTVLMEEVIVVVEETLGDIENISAGEVSAIVGKLESAADKLEDGKINGALGSLNAFINQIEALINSGQLSAAEGRELIAVVELIIDAID